MSHSKSIPGWNQPHDHELPPIDEGGLRAPPGLTGWRKAWWWFDFIILVKLARLRFIAVLVAIGAVITQWDTLAAYYDRWTRPGQTDLGGSSDVEWFCPMHPAVVRDNSKDKCPVCFMPLSKRKKGDGKEEILPAGIVNRVQLSPYRVVLAGVQTWQVDEQPLTKEITAVGFVEFNERGQRKISARVKGRIDQLFVSETGQMVEAGDVLASLYSPDLNVTVQNLVDAHRNNNPSLERSARTRLQLLGISDDQIDEIMATGKSNTHLKIRSPISGHVIKKHVLDGDYVDEGSPLYEIADLSTVWIQAQVYEDDLAFLPVEQMHTTSGPIVGGPKVEARTRAFPNEPFEGSLAFVYPHVDQDTRTVTIRCEVPNPGHKLRPGTTATVKLIVPAQQVAMLTTAIGDDDARRDYLSRGLVLSVPETSVIDTGSQTIVYRETLPGVYEGTQVELGPKMSGPDQVTFFPVLKGLKHGDRIVTAGSFLVDAETRLNPAAGSIYFGGSGGGKSGSSVTSARPSTPEDPDAKIHAAMASLSAEDRKIAESQRLCPVLTTSRLGSMGVPIKLQVDGQTVFICCDACKDGALGNPAETLAKVAKLKQGKSAPADVSPPATTPDKQKQAETTQPAAPAKKDEVMNGPAKGAEAKIQAAMAKLSAEDRKLAEAQSLCPVLENSLLGSMGKPVKVIVDGKPVFLCCEACREDALANPQETLEKVNKLKAAAKAAPAK